MGGKINAFFTDYPITTKPVTELQPLKSSLLTHNSKNYYKEKTSFRNLITRWLMLKLKVSSFFFRFL